MKVIGVTGGSGFIGKYVRERLLADGYEVLVFDRTRHRNEIGEGETFFAGDIRDATAVTEFAAHVDGIIHLAAVLGTQETISNPRPSVETNILGGLNVLEAANQYDLPVVYAGVGNHWMRTEGGGAYTITKTTVEDFAKMYNKNRDGRVSVVRPVNAYGPRQSVAAPYGSSKVRKILPSFACRALLGHDVEVYGDGTQVSDCVHVRDVATVFVQALQYTDYVGPYTDFEVGPPRSADVNEIAELVIAAAGSDSKIKHLPMRPGEVPNAVVSANVKSLSRLGIDPLTFTDLKQGIQETVDFYRESWLPNYQVD